MTSEEFQSNDNNKEPVRRSHNCTDASFLHKVKNVKIRVGLMTHNFTVLGRSSSNIGIINNDIRDTLPTSTHITNVPTLNYTYNTAV